MNITHKLINKYTYQVSTNHSSVYESKGKKTCGKGILHFLKKITNITKNVQRNIKPDEAATFKKVCDVVSERLLSDPKNANGLFRQSLSLAQEKEMKKIFSSEKKLNKANENPVLLMYTKHIQKQCQKIFINKLTINDAFKLNTLVGQPEKIISYFESKINTEVNDPEKSKEMLKAAFTVFNAYRKVCEDNIDDKDVLYSLDCLKTGGLPLSFFELDYCALNYNEDLKQNAEYSVNTMKFIAKAFFLVLDAYRTSENSNQFEQTRL